jgi:hypothetical protein
MPFMSATRPLALPSTIPTPHRTPAASTATTPAALARDATMPLQMFDQENTVFAGSFFFEDQKKVTYDPLRAFLACAAVRIKHEHIQRNFLIKFNRTACSVRGRRGRKRPAGA